MKLLTANTTYNVDQLAERLQMSRRTVYRYIDTFREAGFVIKKSGDCIRLDKESPHFRDISQLVHFTEEEAVILKNTIENIDDTNMLKQNLKRKLYSVYDNKTLADTVVRGKNAPNIRRLIEAIEQERQAVLHGYLSAHGGGVRDRRVEPFAFTTNYVQVWCYDLESHTNKLFKTSRIGSVELSGSGVGAPRSPQRGIHRRLPHARRGAPPRAAGTGNAGLQPVVRGVSAGRTRCETAGAGTLVARHGGGRNGRGGTLRRGAAGRHPHRRLPRADGLYPRIYCGKHPENVNFSLYFHKL